MGVREGGQGGEGKEGSGGKVEDEAEDMDVGFVGGRG